MLPIDFFLRFQLPSEAVTNRRQTCNRFEKTIRFRNVFTGGGVRSTKRPGVLLSFGGLNMVPTGSPPHVIGRASCRPIGLNFRWLSAIDTWKEALASTTGELRCDLRTVRARFPTAGYILYRTI